MFAGNVALNTVNSAGRNTGQILGHTYLSARLAWLYMTGEWPVQIDHRNRIRSADRWDNLRDVDNAKNAQNRGKRSDNTSGHPGVSFKKNLGKWQAEITVFGDRKYLGVFPTQEEAVAARHEAEQHYGFGGK